MDSRSSNLLDMAMSSLNIDAAKEKRRKIFDANQRSVSDIARVCTNIAGHLQVKPNINGETDSQALQPLKYSDSFEIELNKLLLPNQCGIGTLRDAIQRACHENNVSTNGEIDTATFTSVVTAMGGQHAENDTNCTGVTKAEFVPVFNSLNYEKRALVLCYSLNGETKLRVDHIKVRGSMTCLGRKSGSTTALQAIEIPNLIAAEMSEDHPELFAQLQKNACLVAFVEYDLLQPQPIYAANASNMFATRGGPVMRGSDMGVTRGGSDFSSSATRGGGSKGISAYSVIGQGSQAQDHSSSVYESGQRILKKIHVYIIGAIVVNTNEQTLIQSQWENIASLMQARANELNNLYLPYKTYILQSFIEEMESHIEKYNINCQHTDIIEHAILRLGSIDENPTNCQINSSQRTPQYFFIDFGLPPTSVNKLVVNLQAMFGNEFCQYTPEFNQRNGTQAVRFSLEFVSKNISHIKKNINEILSDPRNLLAYQKYSCQESSSYNNVIDNFTRAVQALEINIRTDCVEIILLKMFSCEEELHTARFRPGKSYVDKMIATHFFFDISENAAKQVVDRINQKFPNQARFVCANTQLADKGATLFSEISIDNSLLTSAAFLSLFQETLNNVAENEPLLIEKLRIQSGAQQKTSGDYANKLFSMALLYRSAENANQLRESEVNPKQRLGEALLNFSTVIISPQCKKSERFTASDTVRRALAFFESTQTSAENESFKEGDKKAIKEAQKALGLRK